MTTALTPAPLELETGNARQVLQAAADAARNQLPAVLALVLQTEGSTYSRAGTCVLFAQGEQVGWLSGGCLEPALAEAAQQVARDGRIRWMAIDTRDDASLFSGNAVGCRGCQWIGLLPLHHLPALAAVLDTWLEGRHALYLDLAADGHVGFRCAASAMSTDLAVDAADSAAPSRAWHLQWHRPPLVHIHGAGPETELLVPLLTRQGWRVQVEEPRAAWRARLPAPDTSTASPPPPWLDAALIMHHNFELDLQALIQLGRSRTPFIGLLGPRRRKDDLFQLIDADTRAALQPRLRSPIGLALGGRGPEAIALSIAAQLQAWRHGSPLGDA